MIQRLARSTGGSVRQICATLGMPRSSYYHAAQPTATQRCDQEIGALIEAIFKRHRRRYGYRRIAQELADQGVVCAPQRIRRIMSQRALRALQPKSYQPKTSDGRADRPSVNLLMDQPPPQQPNQVWAGDLTFIPTSQGWLYLAVVIDLCSRKIVGWSLANHMRTELVAEALQQALESRRPAPNLIFHSDRGSQYGSSAYRQRCARRASNRACRHAPILTTTPGRSPSSAPSKPRCYRTAAFWINTMPAPRSLPLSRDITTHNANTPPWTTKRPTSSSPKSFFLTNQLMVQKSVASHNITFIYGHNSPLAQVCLFDLK